MKYDWTPSQVRFAAFVGLLAFPIGLPLALIHRTWRYFAGGFYALFTGRIRCEDGF